MSVLKVANVHFESTGANRIDYVGDTVIRINGSGAAKLPIGGTGTRPTGESGLIRYNTDTGTFEGYNASAWGAIGGTTTWTSLGAAGTATDPSFTTINITSGTSLANSNLASQTLSDAATIAWNTALGQIATVTLAASRTMGAPTNLKVGTYILHVIQGGSGSYTITWNGVFKWPAGVAPTLTTTVGARDVMSFVSDGTNLYGTYINDVK